MQKQHSMLITYIVRDYTLRRVLRAIVSVHCREESTAESSIRRKALVL